MYLWKTWNDKVCTLYDEHKYCIEKEAAWACSNKEEERNDSYFHQNNSHNLQRVQYGHSGLCSMSEKSVEDCGHHVL